MKRYFWTKSLFLIILLAGVTAGCARSEEPSPPEESSISLEASSDNMADTSLPGASSFSEASLSSHVELPSSGNPDISSPFAIAGDQSDSSESKSESASASKSKIAFTESDGDDRLQFTTSEEAVGDADDLEDCKNALNSSLDELGLLVLCSPADGPREYTNKFIEEILDIYRRTNLRTIDKIFEQDPRALTRGIRAAAFYDKEGNRIWVVRTIGNLFRIELGDDGNVHVFKGTLGCQ